MNHPQTTLFSKKLATTLPTRPSILNPRYGWIALFGVGMVWALVQAGLFEDDLFNPGGWPLLARFFRAVLTPDLSPEFLWLTLDATVTTLAFAVGGTSSGLGDRHLGFRDLVALDLAAPQR